jgi:hypothetical protein
VTIVTVTDKLPALLTFCCLVDQGDQVSIVTIVVVEDLGQSEGFLGDLEGFFGHLQTGGALLGGLNWLHLLFCEDGSGEAVNQTYGWGVCSGRVSELRLELMIHVHLDQEDCKGHDDDTGAGHLSMRSVTGA